MPTIIAVDSSLSMCKYVANADDGGSPKSKLKVAQLLASQALDHIIKLKLEYISVLSFSSSVDIICDFTRDLNLLKSSLHEIEIQDKCCFTSLVKFVNHWVVKTWGCMELFQILIITDGRIVSSTDDLFSSDYLFGFPVRLHFLCLETSLPLSQSGCKQSLEDIIKHNNDNGTVLALFQSLRPEAEMINECGKILSDFLDEKIGIFTIDLRCGALSSKVMVFPNPRFSNEDNFVAESKFEILGFLNISDVGNPPVKSRHLILPLTDEGEAKEEDSSKDNSLTAVFAVLLHESLKKENKVALIRVAENWFGIIYSWYDTKPRSNLAASLFPRGFDCVPWLGNIKELGPTSLLSGGQLKSGDTPTFPVQTKKSAKRSYAQPTVAWIRATGLQTDVQRILRSAKKLPEKSQMFYKDLNRLRRAALSFGFNELLEGISSLLERECSLLPGTTNPEVTLQLSHAARVLKNSINSGYNHTLEPLKTDFKFAK